MYRLLQACSHTCVCTPERRMRFYTCTHAYTHAHVHSLQTHAGSCTHEHTCTCTHPKHAQAPTHEYAHMHMYTPQTRTGSYIHAHACVHHRHEFPDVNTCVHHTHVSSHTCTHHKRAGSRTREYIHAHIHTCATSKCTLSWCPALHPASFLRAPVRGLWPGMGRWGS